MRKLLSDRRVGLFYAASGVSALGDDALYMALAVWVKDLTGSTSLAALDMCAVALGMLFAPVTGVLADRVRRRPLLIQTYLASAGLVLLLLLVSGPGQVWLIIAVTFLYGLAGTISTGAQVALVKDIVPPGQLAEANGIEQTILQGMRLVTPALGVGLLTWLGGHAVAVMDAATFLAAVALLAGVRVTEHPSGAANRKHWARELAAGVAYTARTSALRQVTIAYATAFVVFGIYVPLTLQIITVGLHRPAAWLGVLTTIEGIGGALGGITAARAARRTGDRGLMACGLIAMALLTAAAAVPAIAAVTAAVAGFGFFIAWFFVGGNTIRQKHTPNELMARVYGSMSLVMQASQAAGNAVGAVLVLLLFYRNLIYLCATVLALTALYLAVRKPRGATATQPPLTLPATRTSSCPAPSASIGSDAVPVDTGSRGGTSPAQPHKAQRSVPETPLSGRSRTCASWRPAGLTRGLCRRLFYCVEFGRCDRYRQGLC